jgi:CubicO group peptidase (beta-lactamase class C family)
MDAKPFAQWRTQQGLAYTDARVNDITIEMLLHHQAGWDRDATFDPAFGLPDQLACGHSFMDLTPITLIKLMSPQPLQFIPGKRECYSNFGYIVLGRVIEQTTGQSYRDYLRTFMNREIRSGEFDVSQKTPNSALGEPEYQTEPYNVAVMDAAGGTMASATGLCQFMRTFLISGERIPGGNWGFTFFGSIPGASSFVRQEIGSTNRVFAGILNARKNPLDHIPDEVDAILASH